MEVEIYTIQNTPFALGGTHRLVKTTLNEFEVVELGQGFTGILVKNPQKRLWHIAEQTSGALVGTKSTKKAVKQMVKNDIAQGDKKLMDKQVAAATETGKAAVFIPQDKFFSLFKE